MAASAPAQASANNATAAPDAVTGGLGLHAWTLRLSPAHHNAAYWRFRVGYDLIKLDYAYAVLTICHVVVALWSGTSAPRWSLLVLLVPACVQLLAIRCCRQQYAGMRLGLALLLRAAWLAFGSLALQPGSAATGPVQPLVLLVACASRLVHCALQPFVQPLPLKAAVVLQLASMALLLRDSQPLLHCLDALPGVTSPLATTHSVLEGFFHVAAGFLFVTPGVLTGCGAHDLSRVALFGLAYCGLVLPLGLAYKTELLSKASYLLRHACHGCGPGAAGARGPRNSSSGSSSSSSSAERQDISSNHSGSTVGPAELAAWRLVGLLQPIGRDSVVRMLCSPSARLQDSLVWGVLLMLVTWGCCSWVTAAL